MGWLLILVGGSLGWVGWDALKTLVTPYLSSREVAEQLLGPGAQELPDHLELKVRTKWLIQGTSLAQLMAVVFLLAGAAAFIFGVMLLVE
jgi:hypothetical protein